MPPIGDFLPGYEAIGWYGLAAPSKTPPEIVGRLNEAINASLAEPEIKTKLANLGVEPMVMTPAEFTSYIAGDVDKWAKVIRYAAIKPE